MKIKVKKKGTGNDGKTERRFDKGDESRHVGEKNKPTERAERWVFNWTQTGPEKKKIRREKDRVQRPCWGKKSKNLNKEKRPGHPAKKRHQKPKTGGKKGMEKHWGGRVKRKRGKTSFDIKPKTTNKPRPSEGKSVRCYDGGGKGGKIL